MPSRGEGSGSLEVGCAASLRSTYAGIFSGGRSGPQPQKIRARPGVRFLTARFPGFLAYGWGQNQRRASHSVVAILARFFAFAAELVFARTLAIQSDFFASPVVSRPGEFFQLSAGVPAPISLIYCCLTLHTCGRGKGRERTHSHA